MEIDTKSDAKTVFAVWCEDTANYHEYIWRIFSTREREYAFIDKWNTHGETLDALRVEFQKTSTHTYGNVSEDWEFYDWAKTKFTCEGMLVSDFYIRANLVVGDLVMDED